MADILFDTGIKTFSINGNAEVSFNPSDMEFAERLYQTFAELEKKQGEYRERIDGAKEATEIFEVARKLDREMREKIDALLGHVSDAIFGGINCYALADGFPVWGNLLLSIMDAMDADVIAEKKKTNPRMDKYLKKYHK